MSDDALRLITDVEPAVLAHAIAAAMRRNVAVRSQQFALRILYSHYL